VYAPGVTRHGDGARLTAMAEVVVALVMLLGLVGTVVPGVPGLPIVFAGGVGYGVAEGFGRAGVAALAVMGVLLLGGMAASYLLPHRAGVRAGVPRSSLRWGIVGAVVGFFAIPVLGLVVGGVLGVLLAERQRLGDWPPALRATRSVAVGFGLGALLEVLAGVAMVLVWVAWVVVS
jgi:uncharacterized protein